ncbi:MAG TPA: MBL fold metallo-hydrolase [Kofleriaceae bacterium]|nr:MBL fold metallo-hydrolase [Kofleriaceae bacterium]
MVPRVEARELDLFRAARVRRIDRHRSLLLHWLAGWFRPARRALHAPLPPVAPGQVAVTFAGHATALIRYASLRILCDPMLGMWAKGVKRAVQPGLSPAELGDVDLILISHDHADHLHRPTLERLPRSATVIVPPRTAHRVSDLGFARVVELAVGNAVTDAGVDIAATPVHHGDAAGLAYVIRGDGPSVFFCADSAYFSGFAEVGREHRPDIALLPIGGYAPLSFRDRHMTPLDALYAFEDLGSRVMIPIHHGAFTLSYEKLHDPARWLAQLVRERDLDRHVIELAPGESRLFVPPRAATGATPRDDGIPDIDFEDEEEEEPEAAPLASAEAWL